MSVPTKTVFLRNAQQGHGAVLSHERLLELLHYDASTGIFTRRVAASNVPAGSVFGSIGAGGYLRGRLDGRLYYCHRLAVFYMTGSFPSVDAEHENRVRHDNRWDNLRDATRSQNKQNISKNTKSTSGVRNVYFDKASGKWQVKIMLDYKSKSYGYFESLSDAAVMALKAKAETHLFNPEFT